MDFIITHPDGTTLKLNSYEQTSIVESAKQSNAILGVDTVTINVKSATPLELYIGDTINVFGTTYTVNELPTAKRASGLYEYTIKCEGLQYGFIDRVFLMPDNTQGNNLMLDLKGIADILIDNVNRNNTGKQFVLGNYPTPTEAKNLAYNDKNCLQVLQSICKEWDTEFQFVEDEDEITLHLQTIGDVYPYSFKYGQTGGLYNIQRAKGKSDVITRLFVYGGTQNLTYYRHNRLCLPSADKNASYIEDAAAQAVYGIKEGVKNFDDIYPNRIGSVTALGADYKQFVDSSMDFDLNEKWGANDYAEWLALRNLPDTTANRNIFDNDVAGKATKWLIAGQTATIHFNSGNLAGYEIEIVSYDHATKTFKLKPLIDENNYEFPSRESAAFQIGVGDEYVILNINLPLSYKTAAEIKLATEAADYFDTVKAPLAQYTLEIDEFALKRIAGDNAGDTQIFKIGDYIHVVDADAGVDDDIRIQSLDRDLCNVYHYKLTLSNDAVKVNAQTRVLIDVDNIKRVIFENHLSDPNRQRRAYRDATELYDMVFDTDGYFQDKIAPLSIDTTMLKVGARSQQFTLQGITFQANYNADPTRLESSAGQLVHYTINDDDTIRTWNIAAGSFSNLATGGLYIYARCNRNDANGIIVITATQYRFDADSSYYYFLCGNLLSVDNVTNTRPIAMTYGFTTVNGRYIKTGRIQSSDGQTYFDLDTGTICGNIRFVAGQSASDTINGLINSNTNVENALKSANDGGLWPNRLFQLTTPTIGYDTNETAPFGTARLLPARDHVASTWDYAVPLIAGKTHKFVIECYAKCLRGEKVLNAGICTDETLWYYYGAMTKISDYGDGWGFYRRSFTYTTPSSGATKCRLYFQIQQQGDISQNDTAWLICNVNWYDPDNDLAQTTANSALSNASSAQSAAQQAQQDASDATTAINNMNGDNVFSVVEKKAFRPEWKSIQGLNDTTSTPTASTTNGGSYEKALIATNGITDSTITADVSALTTAYSALKTFLNTYALYTSSNSNWGSSGQSDLGTKTKAYYDAETKLYNDLSDYYMRQVEVGGTNLMRSMLRFRQIGNYYNIIGNGIYLLNQNSDSRVWNSANAQHVINLPKGTYTISVYTTEVETDSSVGFSICYASSWIFRAENLSASGFGTVGRHSATFYNASTADVYVMVKAYHAYKLKVEAGNKATDFTAAPEDEATGNGTNLLIGTNGATVDITQTAGGSYQSKQPFTSSKVIGTAASDMWVTLQFKVDNWTNNFSPVNSVVIGKAFDYSDGWSRRISFAPSTVGSFGDSATGVENYDKFIQINSTTRLYWASVKVRKGDNINQSKPIFVCCQNNGTSSTAYTCSLYDVKMEVGSSPTEYTIAPEDVTAEIQAQTDAVREAQAYINSAMTEGTTSIGGGLVLSSMLQVCADAAHTQPKAGLNGVSQRTDGTDVRIWAGGSLDMAATTRNYETREINSPLDRDTCAPFVVLDNGMVILANAIIDSFGSSKVKFDNGTIRIINSGSTKTELVPDTKVDIDAMVSDMQITPDSDKSVASSAASGNFTSDVRTNVFAAYGTQGQTTTQSLTFTRDGGTMAITKNEIGSVKANVSLTISTLYYSLSFAPNSGYAAATPEAISLTKTASILLAGTDGSTITLGSASQTGGNNPSLTIAQGTTFNVRAGVTYTLKVVVSITAVTRWKTASSGVISMGTATMSGNYNFGATSFGFTFSAANFMNRIYGNGMLMSSANNKYVGINSESAADLFRMRFGTISIHFRPAGFLQSFDNCVTKYLVNPLVAVARYSVSSNNTISKTNIYDPQGKLGTPSRNGTGEYRLNHNFARILRVVGVSAGSTAYVSIVRENDSYTDVQLAYNGQKSYDQDYGNVKYQFDAYFYDFNDK